MPEQGRQGKINLISQVTEAYISGFHDKNQLKATSQCFPMLYKVFTTFDSVQGEAIR